MPVLRHNPFHPPLYLFNRHLETIAPALRKISPPDYVRKKISTPDGDFLELDLLMKGNKKLVILSHGLEGNSRRPYISGMAKLFAEHAFDIIAWNYRGCGAEDNALPVTYHTGRTEDMHAVVSYASDILHYPEIYLIGFSMSANTALKYAGDGIIQLPSALQKIIAISPPCDLAASADVLHKGFNTFYERRFMKTFLEKMKRKAKKFPDTMPAEKISGIKTIREFDNFYTAPVNGFKNADEYYRINSSIYYISGIEKETLIITAANDPFLTGTCYPIDVCAYKNNISLEITGRGGHTGFKTDSNNYYSEQRALQFIKS